jgi:hypothetical protein
MGNDVPRPNSKLIKNLEHFREYTSSKLKDIREASEFWKERRSSLVGKTDFDEVVLLMQLKLTSLTDIWSYFQGFRDSLPILLCKREKCCGPSPCLVDARFVLLGFPVLKVALLLRIIFSRRRICFRGTFYSFTKRHLTS